MRTIKGTFFLALIILAGCSAYKRVNGGVNPAFLRGANINSKIENLPFDQAWVRKGFDGRRYSKLYIKPVRTDLLTDWEPSANTFITSKADYDQEARAIGSYFYRQIGNEIRSYEGNRIKLVNYPTEDTITMEIAFTEMEFSHPIARAASLAAPVPGTGAALGAVSDPHAAFAARFTDPTGLLVATVADRKFPPARLVDLNKLTISSSLREVTASWARILAEALNKGRFRKTEGDDRFSIKPW